MKRIKNLSIAAIGAGILALTLNAEALTITGTGNNPSYVQTASADLALSGGVLTIDLKNTASTLAANNPQVLCGLFFSLPSGTTLSTVSASLSGSLPSSWGPSSVVNGSLLENVGEGWVYAGGVSVKGQNAGISAAGFGIFGNTGYFYNDTSHTQPILDGADYGIINGLASPQHLNPGPQISNEIEFKLNVSGALDLNAFSKTLVFQWGTALDEGSGGPGLPPQGSIPDGGSTVILLGAAFSVVGLLRKKLS